MLYIGSYFFILYKHAGRQEKGGGKDNTLHDEEV